MQDPSQPNSPNKGKAGFIYKSPSEFTVSNKVQSKDKIIAEALKEQERPIASVI